MMLVTTMMMMMRQGEEKEGIMMLTLMAGTAWLQSTHFLVRWTTAWPPPCTC